MRLRGDAGL